MPYCKPGSTGVLNHVALDQALTPEAEVEPDEGPGADGGAAFSITLAKDFSIGERSLGSAGLIRHGFNAASILLASSSVLRSNVSARFTALPSTSSVRSMIR